MAYLFTYFTSGESGDKEHIWFSLSDDGLHWTDIGSEEPILTSELGTKGIRDPFMVYDEKLKKYFLIATDLLAISNDWEAFTTIGSRCIRVWESEDLIHWSDERLCEVGIPDAGCVWAPETIYCKEKDMWFVFFASNVREDGEEERKQRIYGTFTKDFKEFTPTFKFIDGETSLIDTNIVWDNGMYYRFTKDETNKLIILEKCDTLVGKEYEKIYSETFENFFGLEGPEAYFLEEMGKWCVIADQYHGNRGYIPFITDDLASGVYTQLSPDQYDFGKQKKRHGGVLKIPQSVADELKKYYK